jgi:protease II
MNTSKQSKNNSALIAKAGEYFVCSELLFRGFNASIMSVDTGIDIIILKENQLIEIQVKTAKLNKKRNDYSYNIKKDSFHRNKNSNPFYIFVLRSEKENNVLILPFKEIKDKLKSNLIFENKNDIYRVSIKFRKNKFYLKSIKSEHEIFLNNWSLIK